MHLYLYDTYQRALRLFEPIHTDHVGLYCCGPTVYDYAHIGNLRTYIFEDLLRRVLTFNGYAVRHVVNITDVGHLVSDADEGEDKMEKGSHRTGESAWAIAERYTAAFQDDMRALNLLPPTTWCRATDHIAEQIDFISTLEEKGFTYCTSDGVYFDTSRQDSYGYLARLDREGLQAGIRVDSGEKRGPTDFALWKFSPADAQRQMEWDSPWGRGFPGWHIECSAMSAKFLSPWFDIHCGGEDHIAVHHNNEIAQTEACYGTRLANFWMHGYFLRLNAEKMSKSSGEFLRLQTLIDKGFEPLSYRYLCLSAHYRGQMSFTLEALGSAQVALNRLREAYFSWPTGGIADAKFVERFTAEINQDLNLPRAMAIVWEVVKSAVPAAVKRATLDAFEPVLGLQLAEWRDREDSLPAEVLALVEKRQQARQQKLWAEADALRDQIASLGFDLEDTASGPRISKH
ncbi:cysteine--tRNA ligase [Paraherbaspirillum soli]|uniref:Cysteine--tRNA ligase n=1 Tax=Paraherbaspirillum soli TaxID=631222 RepID=A0ABW0MDA2_9BURK